MFVQVQLGVSRMQTRNLDNTVIGISKCLALKFANIVKSTPDEVIAVIHGSLPNFHFKEPLLSIFMSRKWLKIH